MEREFKIPDIGKISGVVTQVIDNEFIYLNAKILEIDDDDSYRICKYSIVTNELMYFNVVHDVLNIDYVQLLYYNNSIYVYGNTYKHYDSTLCRFDFEKFETLFENDSNEFPDSHLMFIKNDVLIGIGSTSGTFQCYYSGLLDRDVWFFDISHNNNNNDSGRKFKKVEVSDQDDETVMNGEFLSFLLEDQDETLCLFIGGYDDLCEISYSMEMIIVPNNIRNSELNISTPKCGRTKFYLKPYSDLFEVFKRAPIQSTLIQSMEKKYYRLLLDVEQELYYLDVIFDDFYYYCKLFPHYFTNRFSDIEIIHNA